MSNFLNSFHMAHKNINMDDLIPITKLQDKELKETLETNYQTKLPDYKDIIMGTEYLERSPEHFYFYANPFFPYLYYNKDILIEFNSFSVFFLKEFKIKERIVQVENEYYRLLANKNYEDLFSYIIDKKIIFQTYKRLFQDIPDHLKFKIFINIYTRSEYGFNSIEDNFMEEIFKFNNTPKELIYNQIKNHTSINNNEVTIYRGQSEHSINYDKSYSWTLDFNTALFFANRFGLNGKVYTTNININDVQAFLNNRNEQEVIVKPSNIYNVKEFKFYKVEDTINKLDKDGFIDKYLTYSHKLKEHYFHNPNGIHGVLHCKRVLFLNTIFAYFLTLNNNDTEILFLASIYHDIGRVHDEEDKEHGFLSIKKIKQLKIEIPLKNEDYNIFKFIVENHCVSDDVAINSLKKYNINNNNRVVRLFKIFKDADGLDRVRINDLNPNYLRLLISKKLIMIAKTLLKEIK